MKSFNKFSLIFIGFFILGFILIIPKTSAIYGGDGDIEGCEYNHDELSCNNAGCNWDGQACSAILIRPPTPAVSSTPTPSVSSAISPLSTTSAVHCAYEASDAFFNGGADVIHQTKCVSDWDGGDPPTHIIGTWNPPSRTICTSRQDVPEFEPRHCNDVWAKNNDPDNNLFSSIFHEISNKLNLRKIALAAPRDGECYVPRNTRCTAIYEWQITHAEVYVDSTSDPTDKNRCKIDGLVFWDKNNVPNVVNSGGSSVTPTNCGYPGTTSVGITVYNDEQPSAKVRLQVYLLGGWFNTADWSGYVKYWAKRIELKTFQADKTTINPGQTVKLTWDVRNPASQSGKLQVHMNIGDISSCVQDNGASCSANQDNLLNRESGSLTVEPVQTTTFYLWAYGPSGEGLIHVVSDPILVTVTGTPVPSPSVILRANGSTNSIAIPANTAADLSWNSSDLGNNPICTASGDWSGSKPVSGSESTGDLSSDKNYNLSCTGSSGTASDSVQVNIASSQTGTIKIQARLDGKSWSGSLNFALSGPANLDNTSVPRTYDSVSTGAWILSYISGGPANAKLVGISPVPSLTLLAGKTLTFYFDFGTKTGCDINVNSTMAGSAYSGAVSYYLNGPASYFDNYAPDIFQDVPAGQYQLAFAYGGPGTLKSITPQNPQDCPVGGNITFTMNFATGVIINPSPGTSAPTAGILCWANKDPDRCIGLVTVDKSSPVILYSHSSDPDNDIRSCQWKVYKAGNLNAPVLEQNSCAPLLWDNTLGDYTARLKVIDSGGRSDSTSKNFSIKDVSALTCDFTWDPLSPSASTPVNFYDLTVTPSATDLTKWLWTFEDATPTTSILQNPQGIMFNSSGNKSITLKVTNSKSNTCSLTQAVQARTINPHWKEIIPQ